MYRIIRVFALAALLLFPVVSDAAGETPKQRIVLTDKTESLRISKQIYYFADNSLEYQLADILRDEQRNKNIWLGVYFIAVQIETKDVKISALLIH